MPASRPIEEDMHPTACTPATRSPVVSPINRVVFLSIWPSGGTTQLLKILLDTFEYRVVPPLGLFEEKTPLRCVKTPYVVSSSHSSHHSVAQTELTTDPYSSTRHNTK